jgi:Rho-binding antiterminator
VTTLQPDYSPISCEFHDRLEDLATVRKLVRIRYRDRDGVLQQRDAIVADVFSRAGAEYVSLDSGDVLRLDQLVEVDGAKLSDY